MIVYNFEHEELMKHKYNKNAKFSYCNITFIYNQNQTYKFMKLYLLLRYLVKSDSTFLQSYTFYRSFEQKFFRHFF